MSVTDTKQSELILQSAAREVAARFSIPPKDQKILETAVWESWLYCRDRLSGLPKYCDLIRSFCDIILAWKGGGYRPNVSRLITRGGVTVWSIQPAVACTVHIIERPGALLFVDSGFTCYTDELMRLCRSLFPDFDKRRVDEVLTHADVDHCGVVRPFERIFVSGVDYENFAAENRGEPCLRETLFGYRSACHIYKLVSGYVPPRISQLRIIGDPAADPKGGLAKTGVFSWEGLNFDLYQSAGGHVRGGIVLLEPEERLIFAGDLFVSGRHMTGAQRTFSRITLDFLGTADILPELAAQERRQLQDLPGSGVWDVCCGHGGFTRWER